MKTGKLLVDRKELCKLLGDMSISHIIRLERYGNLSKAKIQAGRRLVRYDVRAVQKLVETRKLY